MFSLFWLGKLVSCKRRSIPSNRIHDRVLRTLIIPNRKHAEHSQLTAYVVFDTDQFADKKGSENTKLIF